MADARIQWEEVPSQNAPQDQGAWSGMAHPRPNSTWNEKLMHAWNWLLTIAIIVIIGSGCGLLGWFGHELTSKPEFSVISQKISQKGQKRLAAVVDELPRVCANSNRTPEACGFLLEDGLLSVVQSEPKRYISQAKRSTADAPENKAE